MGAQSGMNVSFVIIGPIVHWSHLYDLIEVLYRLIMPSQVVEGSAFALPGHYIIRIHLNGIESEVRRPRQISSDRDFLHSPKNMRFRFQRRKLQCQEARK
jgi:hypothetical protein